MSVLTSYCCLHTRYYEGGVSSVYFWDLDEGFAGVVLLKKSKFLIHVLIRGVQS